MSTGDKVVRELPNGMKEIYEVEQVEYEEGLPPEIPPCCKLQVRKEDDQTRNKTLSSTNIFNGRGDFSAVNFQSLDNSVNIQDRPETIFGDARQKLHGAIGDQVLLKELLAHLRLMEDGSSQPKKIRDAEVIKSLEHLGQLAIA